MAFSHIVRCSVLDINTQTISLTNNPTVLVRHFSTAEATMYLQAISSDAPVDLDSCAIRNSGKTEYGEKTEYGILATFENVYDNTFVFYAADSKGASSREEMQTPFVDYIKLTCNMRDCKIDTNGTATLICGGDYFNGSFGFESNSVSVRFRYRKRGSTWSNYYPMTATEATVSYTAHTTLGGLDYKATYDFEFVASDKLMTVSSYPSPVSSKPVFHWGESDVTFEVPAKFNEGIDGNLEVSGHIYVGTSGNKLIEESGDQLCLYSPGSINLSANSIAHNGKSVAFPEYGTWTPWLSVLDSYVTYITQSGWYNKCGNVVTVGFFLKATVNSMYNGSEVWIYGLNNVAYPVQKAAGGGICSGAYVSAGFNFQGFVAETNGVITTRVQACNNYSAADLATSADGCKYPSSSSTELTLSGTITYMTN